MPVTDIFLFRDNDGSVPLLDWFHAIPRKAVVKCRIGLERLHQLGYELHRPEADYLGDGIYELRISLQGIQYRILYFFHGTTAVVISHGIIKKQKVPPKEIEKAIGHKIRFESNPQKHSSEGL